MNIGFYLRLEESTNRTRRKKVLEGDCLLAVNRDVLRLMLCLHTKNAATWRKSHRRISSLNLLSEVLMLSNKTSQMNFLAFWGDIYPSSPWGKDQSLEPL